MSQFLKNKGWMFQLTLLAVSVIVLILSFVYMTRYVDAHDFEQSSVDFRNYLRFINDLILYLAVIGVVALAYLTILNVYKRRHFKMVHLISGIIVCAIPLIFAFVTLAHNISAIPLFYEDLKYVNEWHQGGNPSASFLERTSQTLHIANVLIGLFILGFIANIVYFILRYRIDEKNVKVKV